MNDTFKIYKLILSQCVDNDAVRVEKSKHVTFQYENPADIVSFVVYSRVGPFSVYTVSAWLAVRLEVFSSRRSVHAKHGLKQ